ncbi:MAG: glutaredoxin, partial [Pseudomonadota bacterium]|nr:glutaredoxin [Pseudomonadota bacterium]
MLEKANGSRTVPQIFINDVHIGGCDELYEMDRKGALNDIISNNINE